MKGHSTLTSRADLLRGLSACAGSDTLLAWMKQQENRETMSTVASFVGYKYVGEIESPRKVETLRVTGGLEGKINVSAPKISGVLSQPRPPEQFWYVKEHQQQNETPDDDSGLPLCLRNVESFRGEIPQIPGAVSPPAIFRPLTPDARLLPFLRRVLSQSHGKRLDIPKLVKKVSEFQILHQIPLDEKRIPAGKICLILDFNSRIMSFWDDIWDLLKKIQKSHGHLGLEVRLLDDNPMEEYKCPPSANSVVLIVSDLGLLAGKESSIATAWQFYGRRFAKAGHQPTVLMPLSSSHLSPSVIRYYKPVLWSKTKRLKTFPARGGEHDLQEKTERLLGLVSLAVHVEPELLRAVGRLLPSEMADSGVEAAVWQHPDIECDETAFYISPKKRAKYLQRFRFEKTAMQKEVLKLLHQFHSSQFAGVYASELLQASQLMDCPKEEIANLDWAENFMLGFIRTWKDQRKNRGMHHYAYRELDRLPASLKKSDYPSLMYGMAYSDALLAGDRIEPDYSPDIVLSVIAKSISPRKVRVMQQGESLVLFDTEETVKNTGSWLAEFMVARNGFLLYRNDAIVTIPLKISEPICILTDDSSPLRIKTSLEQLTLYPMTKPSWADGIGRDGKGLFVFCSWLGKTHRLYWQNPTAKSKGHWQGTGPVGRDQHGLCADLKLQGITQRFRWLEPNSFMMGSPEDELERYDDETQHKVTFSKGFWLADSTVTQEFWQLVMGKNPSDFTGERRPVENVSWKDVQQFIKKLNKLVPELSIRLPSEAEWEYGCRAGTTTPFSFGNNITVEQVNYDGRNPYNDGKKGEYRKQTVEVKALPCNSWGLYEMHGNVWEWCQDWWQEDLGKDPVIDPQGPKKGENRVLRGGSWVSDGGDVRSAFRNGFHPGGRLNYTGFRLARGY